MGSKLKALTIIGGLFLAMQLIVPSKNNPPVDSQKELTAPENIKSILKRSCYDCHSNETKWPWYANIAPISWVASAHVRDGRAWVNFSEWEGYDEANRTRLKKLIFRSVSHAMPPQAYTLIHEDAKLTAEEKKMIRDWTGIKPEEVSIRD